MDSLNKNVIIAEVSEVNYFLLSTTVIVTVNLKCNRKSVNRKCSAL